MRQKLAAFLFGEAREPGVAEEGPLAEQPLASLDLAFERRKEVADQGMLRKGLTSISNFN